MNKSSFLKRNGNRRLNVMFGDFAYFNRHTTNVHYVPLAIGMIAQYAKQQFGDDINVSLFKNIDKFFDQAAQNPPDVIGLSVYFWNLNINQYVVKCVREKFGRNVIIVLGGPCIDSDAKEQHRFLTNVFPGADAIVLNEGEISFSNILQKVFGNCETVFKDPIDGATFMDGNHLVRGRPIGLSMDLSTMESPYLSGLMDEFMNSDNQPAIQTSRFCPYTCSFCVSGKNRGKLRGYPIEQIKEELKYVSKKYADKPHHTMYLVDENFGILKRDVEIAEAIKKCNESFGYPRSVAFYNDKRFTETSRKILEILADLTQRGVVLALQTGNPLSLKVSNRRNVTDEEINDAIAWAQGINLPISTDLIFGLPLDTRNSFVGEVDRSIKRGFDNVLVENLILMDGIEMNRPEFRKKYNIKTKYRILGTSYTKHNGTFLAEHEEVVVSSNSFTYEDFLEVRHLNFMFYAVFILNFHKWFFHFARHLGVYPSKFFSHFFKPDRNANWPKRYISFLDDLKHAIQDELNDTREEMLNSAKKKFIENNNDVGESTRININFGGRINYLEGDWVKSVLLRHLDEITNMGLTNDDRNLASKLIDLNELERVDLKNNIERKSLNISYDVIDWKKNKFQESLSNLKMPEKFIKFSTSKNQTSLIDGFKKRFASYNDQDYYHEAMEYIRPSDFLLYNLSYE
jgi:radical SAM superfamily enzyme YgiQ (UPF0313 family)